MSCIEDNDSIQENMKNNKILCKILLIISLAAIFYFIPKEYLGEKFPICLFRILFHKKCWGCGTTRAFWCILHLRFQEAFAYNKMVIITFPLCTGCTIHWIFHKKVISE
jgi:hypothetical protein